MAGKSLPDVFVVNDYSKPTGGSSVVALLSAGELARRGSRVTTFTAKGPQPAETPGMRSVCLGQEEIRDDPNRVRAMVNGLLNVNAARQLGRELASQDPKHTIVHVHTYTMALSASVIATALDMGFPVVLSLHDFFITCPSGGFFRHRESTLCEFPPLSWNCVTCNCDRRNFAHKQWRVARTLLQNQVLRLDRRITHFVGISDFSVNVMKPFLPPATPITTIRNPVPCENLGPAPVAENDAFVFIGRFSREKGPQLFAQAANRLGIPAVFIGDGDLNEELRRECPNAIFTGWLPEQEVRAWMRRARALVFPPLWYETLGLVVVEAAAAGVPAIIPSRCAATDFVRHGETGLVFEHSSVDSLCDRITELSNAPSKAAQMGEAAYHWYWSDPWTVDRHVDELLHLYDQILVSR
jgi:glycosyltransferase involved in cell wall biosynthesis